MSSPIPSTPPGNGDLAGSKLKAQSSKLQAADAAWMSRALRLASLSLGMTWPNPGVGCVLVRGDEVVGEGRHLVCGGLHAETAALTDCTTRGLSPRGATAYVTLAPCTRHGRQPPCVEALITAGVARVVAALADPVQDDAAVRLRAAGIAYETGLLGHVARHLHGGFLSRVQRQRPRVTGKWAASSDGFLAAAPGTRTPISCPDAYALMRRRRRAFDGIIIGVGTARSDDPALTAPRPRRHGDQLGPLRIVLAADGTLPPGRLVADGLPTLVVHRPEAAPPPGVAGLAVADAHDPAAILAALGRLGLNDVMIEGGARVHAAWLPWFDRCEVYLGAHPLRGGVPAPPLPAGDGWVAESAPLRVGTTSLARWTRLP